MWYLICGILICVNFVTAILLLCINRINRQKLICMEEEQKKREFQNEYDQHRAEILSLQSQINPHFLYNTLEVIRSEAIMNDDFEAAEMAEALANYFRYNISRKGNIVTLGEELDNVENYISIQKKRFEERITYKVEYHTEKAEARAALMPKLTLQPLVENSIYHGIEKRARGGAVIVHITVTDTRLILQVMDDGPGMGREELEEVERRISGRDNEKKEKDKHGGIALANINKRVKMLYGEEYGLTFSSVKNIGTEAEVTIPYYTE